MFNVIRGAWRTLLFCSLVLAGAVLVLFVGWLPIRIRGIGLGPWIVHGIAAIFSFALGLRVHLSDPQRWRDHAGFIFSNHTTYIDILTILSTIPVRFVAKAELRRWPFIGWLAAAIGCVFVQRDDKSSRKETRHKLALIEKRPPVVLFPEGKTAPYGTLLPFRRGAFEIAVDGGIPYLPAAFIYSDPRLIDWKTRPALSAWWEMLSRPGFLDVQVELLDLVQPDPADDPAGFMSMTRQDLLAVLVEKGNYVPETAVEQRGGGAVRPLSAN